MKGIVMKPRVYKEKVTLENLFPCWVVLDNTGRPAYFKTWNLAMKYATEWAI
jgi:hypothetical protein